MPWHIRQPSPREGAHCPELPRRDDDSMVEGDLHRGRLGAIPLVEQRIGCGIGLAPRPRPNATRWEPSPRRCRASLARCPSCSRCQQCSRCSTSAAADDDVPATAVLRAQDRDDLVALAGEPTPLPSASAPVRGRPRDDLARLRIDSMRGAIWPIPTSERSPGVSG